MGLPGRASLARILPLALVLSALPAAAAAGPVPVQATTAAAGSTRAAGHARAGQARAARSVTRTRPRREAFVPGRVLVGFEAAAGTPGRRAAVAAVDGRVASEDGRAAATRTGTGGTRSGRIGTVQAAVVQLDPGADVRAAARRLAARPGVAFAEPDWIRRIDACDPGICWHLRPNQGAEHGADVVAAHDAGATGGGQTVAVVDTGVATGVDDLAGRVSARLRCTDTGCVPTTDPPVISHGTEVASVVAALDNDTGTTGVAPDATVVSYRVDGTGGGIPISYLRKALLAIAADPQIDVVNLSLGGSQWSQAERDAVDDVLAAGKVVVASAGNTGDRIPQYPAAFPGVISVGATDDGGQVAGFSSYGKVDVVAPGDCVAVAEVPGFDQDRGCPGDDLDGVAFNSGTSFSAPIVSGILALAASRSPLVARLALESTADPDSPGDADDAKQWAHGLVDADAFVAAHDPGAPPALVLETSGDQGAGYRIGSGDGQLPHPVTTWVAYAVQAGDGVAAQPGSAGLTGASSGTAAFAAVAGDAGTYRAALASGPLAEGLGEEQAAATVDGQAVTGSVPVLTLAADDQAPGVDLTGADDDAWRRLDSVDGADLDDVYAVTLGKGDRLDVAIAGLSPDPVAALLFRPGTEDVYGQLDRAVACGGGAVAGCPTAGLHFEAATRGTYLLDVYSTGLTGGYRLTWTVRNAAGLPIEVTVGACSPNGDGVRDRCAWTAGDLTGWTVRSFVTSGASLVTGRNGPGNHSWDGGTSPQGGYALRVLYAGPGGRDLLRAFVLTLDTRRPAVADATATPNPFEPRPHDGDRDTTTMAMTSSERGRFRAVIYRYASTDVVRVLDGGEQAAGRQRVAWTGRTSSGAWLRGTFSYVLETTDAAGNTARSQRHHVRVL